jgi:hypothetical protein
VTISVSPERMLLFDQATGRRIPLDNGVPSPASADSVTEGGRHA